MRRPAILCNKLRQLPGLKPPCFPLLLSGLKPRPKILELLRICGTAR